MEKSRMWPEIVSPKRNHTTSSSAIQGSPFFDYLGNLSPLKPVDSVHAAQAFAHPPPVFSSPRVSLPKDLSLLNRLLHEGMEHEENKFVSSSICEKGKEFTVPLSGCDISASVISPVKGEVTSFDTIASDQSKSKDETMSPFFGCSPSKYVEQFLVDPMEEDFYVIDSSELRLKPTPLQPESSLVHLGNQQDVTSQEWSERTEMELFSGSNSLEYVDADKKAVEADIPQGSDESSIAAISAATMKTLDVRKLGQAHIENNEKTASLLSDSDTYHSCTSKCGNHSISSQTGVSHDQNSVDQVTSVLAFLHSKDSICSIDEQMAAVSADCSKSSCQQVSKIPVNCDDGDRQHGGLDNTPLPFEESLGDVKPGTYLNMKLDPELNCPMEHHTALGCKASNQLQRGMRRRCLDFEALETCKNLRASSWNCTNFVSKTGTLAGYAHNSEKNAMSLMTGESSGTSDCKQLVITLKRETSADTRCFQSSDNGRFSSCSYKAPDFASDKIECTVRKHGNSSVTVGMPSGIGLHLNSLATAMSLGRGVSMIKSAKGSVSMKGMRPLPVIKGVSSDGLEGCFLSASSGENLAVAPSADFAAGKAASVVENTRMDREELQSSEVAYSGVIKSSTCLHSLTVGIKPLQARLPLEAQDRNKSPLGKKRPPLQDIMQQPAFGMGEEFNESSPKKRRKSATITDKQGCKRCNCKKSKCLKLYCDCFAAGVYCVESCTCQECLNKPEHEHTVLGTRQQIESRNPLAFAPKIIREAASPPNNGKECSEVPTSARHKRGCNCKKSMCLKKYCECYQAAVGCSEGCRCEGCKNVYGKKEGSEEIQDKEAQLEELDKESSEEKLGVLEVRNDNMHLRQWHAKDLSPITPSFRQGRSTIKLRPSGKRHFTSEATEASLLFQPCAKPPRSPGKVLGSTKGVQGNGTAIHKTGLEFSASSGIMSKTEMAGEFSSQWDGLGDICTVTPLSQLPLRPTATSVSDAEGVEASPFHGQQNEISGSSSRQSISRYLCSGGSPSCFLNQSPVCTSDSITGEIPVNLQATPVTPAPSTTICNAGNKLTVDSTPCIKLHNLSGCAEDDTPDILKNNGSPMKILKARSPNQKRVSPPHNYGLKETTRRESRLPSGLGSGRKLIQQSMTSFPPPSPLDEGAG